MEELKLTPKQVQAMLKVSSTTLRRYANDFYDLLSPAARPGSGYRRAYTRNDLAVLSRVAQLYREGKTRAQALKLIKVMELTPSGVEAATLPAALAEVDKLRELVEVLAVELRDSKIERADLKADLKMVMDRLDQLERRGVMAAWRRLRGKR